MSRTLPEEAHGGAARGRGAGAGRGGAARGRAERIGGRRDAAKRMPPCPPATRGVQAAGAEREGGVASRERYHAKPKGRGLGLGEPCGWSEKSVAPKLRKRPRRHRVEHAFEL